MRKISKFIKLWITLAIVINLVFGGLYINEQTKDDTSPEDSSAALLYNQRIWVEIASGNDGRPDNRVYSVGEHVKLGTYMTLEADQIGILTESFDVLPSGTKWNIESDFRDYATSEIDVNMPNPDNAAVRINIQATELPEQGLASGILYNGFEGKDFDLRVNVRDFVGRDGNFLTGELVASYPVEGGDPKFIRVSVYSRADGTYVLGSSHDLGPGEDSYEEFTFPNQEFDLVKEDGSFDERRVIAIRKFQDKVRIYTYLADFENYNNAYNAIPGSWTSVRSIESNVPDTTNPTLGFYSFVDNNAKSAVQTSVAFDNLLISEVSFPNIDSGRNAMKLRYQYNSDLLEYVDFEYDESQFLVLPENGANSSSCTDLKDLFPDRDSVHKCKELSISSQIDSFEELVFNGNRTDAFTGILYLGEALFKVKAISHIALDGVPANSLEFPDPHEPSVYVLYPFGREDAIASPQAYLASDFFTVESHLDARGDNAADPVDYFTSLDISPSQRPGVLMATYDICLGDFNLALENGTNVIVDLDDFGTLAKNYTFDTENPRVLTENNRFLDIDRVAVNGNYIIDITDFGIFARNYDEPTCKVNRSDYPEYL